MKQGPQAGAARAPLLVLGALALMVAGFIWYSFATGDAPQQQQRVVSPAGREHLVSLWTTPSPPIVGRVELMAQVADPGGWPGPVGALEFRYGPTVDDGLVVDEGMYSMEGPGRGHVYTSEVDIDRPGTWRVVVVFTADGEALEAPFEVEAGD